MRMARPWRLRGRWGAWVKGNDVEPDMLLCLHTRNGKSWFSIVGRVLRQSASGAICERIDIDEGDIFTPRLPLHRQEMLVKIFDSQSLELIHEKTLETIAKVYRPAPALEDYEYYEVYKKECALYQILLDQVMQELSSRLSEMNDRQSKEKELAFRTNGAKRGKRGNAKKSKRLRRAKIHSSQPILDPSYLPKTEPSGPYTRLYGPDSVR